MKISTAMSGYWCVAAALLAFASFPSIAPGWEIWGKAGTEPGEFDAPHGVAIDGAGNLYVSDRGNNRIQVRSADTGQWTVLTSSALPFDGPRGIALDAAENLYVGDVWNDVIQVRIAATGAWFIIGESGTEPGQFDGPNTIAFDFAGRMYVVDRFNHRIQVRDLAGHWTVWDKPGSLRGFVYPSGVGIDADGNVYVTDNHRLVRRSAATETWEEVGGQGTDPGKFYYPRKITFDGMGRLLVTDGHNHRIQIRSLSCGGWYTIGGDGPDEEGAGSGLAQFRVPHGITLDEAGTIYVADTFNHRIQVCDSYCVAATYQPKLERNEWEEVVLQFRTDCGESYAIDISDDLANGWVLLRSGIIGDGGRYEWADAASAVLNRRFYRVRAEAAE